MWRNCTLFLKKIVLKIVRSYASAALFLSADRSFCKQMLYLLTEVPFQSGSFVRWISGAAGTVAWEHVPLLQLMLGKSWYSDKPGVLPMSPSLSWKSLWFWVMEANRPCPKGLVRLALPHFSTLEGFPWGLRVHKFLDIQPKSSFNYPTVFRL